ncbi:MAG TPA: GNAT family N-acetyltransferase [Candidatus Kapabacteria bacterium]|nr:GNAT family N-acetyltransferase [Candidatus Kapabacteria bacterium]
MALQIRLLRHSDVEVLASVADGVFDDPVDVPAARAFLNDPRHHIVVAVDDGVVVGFVSALHYVHPDKTAPELWINEVAVAPTHWRRGTGARLMRTMLDHAAGLGCAEAWVLTGRTNMAAMRLYASVGGAEFSEDVVMFSFPLAPAQAPEAGGR